MSETTRATFPESVRTERLRLERWRAGDEPAIVAVWAAGDTWSWLRPESRGRGLATEGARAACEAAFGTLGLERVVSLILPANERSQAVAIAVGMERWRTVTHPQLRERLEVWSLER